MPRVEFGCMSLQTACLDAFGSVMDGIAVDEQTRETIRHHDSHHSESLGSAKLGVAMAQSFKKQRSTTNHARPYETDRSR